MPAVGKRTSPRLATVRRAQARAISHGATVHPTLRVEWDAYGRCERPATVELHGRPDRIAEASRIYTKQAADQARVLAAVQAAFPGAELAPGSRQWPTRLVWRDPANQSATLTLHVPCRQCRRCLRARAKLWEQRARSELAVTTWRGARTWFVTLTCRPDVHHHHLATARHRLDTQGIDFDQLDDREQFRERHRPLAREITKWLKRVRKRAKARMRYLCVTEIHLGGGAAHGEPHVHLLVHELEASAPIRERDLRETWPHGHAKAKLVTEVGSAVYLTKYLAKDARARVRASARYGQLCDLDGLTAIA